MQGKRTLFDISPSNRSYKYIHRADALILDFSGVSIVMNSLERKKVEAILEISEPKRLGAITPAIVGMARLLDHNIKKSLTPNQRRQLALACWEHRHELRERGIFVGEITQSRKMRREQGGLL